MVNPLRTATFLSAIAIAYLVIPYLLFLWGWIETPLALLFGALILLGAWLTVREYHGNFGSEAAATSYRPSTMTTLLTVMGVSVGLIMLSGIGGIGFQHYDWDKHNAVLSDLVHQVWPVGYTYYGGPVALVYYIAYYLPAAWIGKIWGWPAANFGLAIWSAVGLSLTLFFYLWLVRARRVWLALLVFLFFSGLDVLGSLVTHSSLNTLWPERLFPAVWSYWTNHDAWSAWQYSSNLKLLFAVPNQAIAGWLLTSLLLLPLLAEKRSHSALFLWGLSALWSPFITIGLAPVLLVGMWPEGQGNSPDWKRIFSIQNLIGLLCLGIVSLFYATKLTPVEPLLDEGFRAGFYLALIDGWQQRFNYLLLLLLFYLLEFGLFGWLIWRAGVLRRKIDRRLFWATTAWLLLLPLWVFGAVNDLVMRASIPALWVYTIFLAQSVSQHGRSRVQRWLLWGALLIAALNPVQDLLYHGAHILERGTFQRLPPDDETILEQFEASPDRLIQYLGSQQAPFFAFIAKTPAPTEVATTPLLFGDRIVLTQHNLQSRRLLPGAHTQLELALESLQPISAEMALATRLVDSNGRVLWEMQGWPSGRNTTTWTPFRTYFDVRDVQIPPDAAPGTYVMQAYFFDPTTFDKLPVAQLPGAKPLGDIVSLAYLNVDDPRATGNVEPRPIVSFGGELGLLSTSLAAQEHWVAGEAAPVTLVWRALRPMTQNYVQTLQLIDEAGRLVVQQDRQLFDGALPTTLWQPDLDIIDATTFPLPSDLAPGRYALILAWYTMETGARLALDPQPANGEDAFLVAEVSVRRP